MHPLPRVDEIPPEVDSGSAAAMVWVKRFEKMMLVIAYILTFLIIFTAAVVSKGVTFFMIAQVGTVHGKERHPNQCR